MKPKFIFSRWIPFGIQRSFYMTMQPLLSAILFAFSLTSTNVSFAQQSIDPLTIRKAINESCLATVGVKETIDTVEGVEISDGDRIITARLYRPKEPTPLPMLIFIHGGGFVAGNLDTHDNICRYLCKHTPCIVLSVDYRLAPEHKFPAQLLDCNAAAVWTVKNAGRLGGDSDRLAVVGDSAGGTLAAALCQQFRNRQSPRLRAQLLVNPGLDFSGWDTEQFQGYQLFRDFYLNDLEDGSRPLASPLLADSFEGLPPALVIVGETDPLRTEGESYVMKLREAGVPANAYCQFGEGHLGPLWAAASPFAQEPMDVAIGFLRATLWPSKERN